MNDISGEFRGTEKSPLARRSLGRGLDELTLRQMNEPCGISRSVDAADQLFFEVHTDHLTGLADRAAAERLFQQLLLTENTGAVVVFIDLDKFKIINDTYGHEMGDEALRITANALMAGFKREYEIVSRWSGDEFVLVLPSRSGEHGAIAHDRRNSNSSVDELERSVANYIEFTLSSLIDTYARESARHAFLAEMLRFSVGLKSYDIDSLRSFGSLEELLKGSDGPDRRMYVNKRQRQVKDEQDAVANQQVETLDFEI